MGRFQYKAFGVIFSIPFPIDGLEQVGGQPEIVVSFGATPEKLENVIKKGVLFQVNLNEFLFQLEGVGRYWAKNNVEIIITKKSEATSDDIAVFLFSSVFAFVLQNKNVLTLHANIISKNDSAFLIAGNSGAGKSTLTYAMLQNGYSFFSDDICAVSFHKNKPFAPCGLPRLKLWQDALEHFSVKTENLKPIRNQLKKYYFPIPINQKSKQLEIKKMIVLNTHNQKEIITEKLNGIDKFNAVKANTYRYQFLSEEKGVKPHFLLSTKFANCVDVFRVTRPNFDFDIDELQKTVEKIFGS